MSNRQRTNSNQTSPSMNAPALPPTLTTRAINDGVDALLGLHERRKAKRMKYSTMPPPTNETDLDSPSPIMDEFIRTRSLSIVPDLTNFSTNEFSLLWNERRLHITKTWNVGSGNKSRTSPRDMLFMTLTTLKHGGSWDIIAALFKFKSSTFAKSILGFIRVLHPYMMQHYVHGLADKWSMLKLATSGNQFTEFPSARYAVEVTFQQTHAPSGSFETKKAYFSKKHGLYGLEVEMSVLPNGFAIGVSPSTEGSISDITIFESNEAFHRAQLAKQIHERDVRDIGPLRDEFPDQWAGLADKGYQGWHRRLRAITSNKRPPRGL
ncbi:hypothetical protein AeMF1_006416 [Aphanomyces euteiches]|nr:hypothetical protein AeMF1_006416 [Aphanomyces euteiches]